MSRKRFALGVLSFEENACEALSTKPDILSLSATFPLAPSPLSPIHGVQHNKVSGRKHLAIHFSILYLHKLQLFSANTHHYTIL